MSAFPALYLFIGHFMRDRHETAKFGAPTDKQQEEESCESEGGRTEMLSAAPDKDTAAGEEAQPKAYAQPSAWL